MRLAPFRLLTALLPLLITAAALLPPSLQAQFKWPEVREERRGGSYTRLTQNLNGQEVPVEAVQETLVESTTTSRIVDRTILKYDANGRPGPLESQRLEVRRDGDVERQVRTTTRRDTNGNAYVAEVERSTTTSSAGEAITKVETERPTQNGGSLELVEIKEMRRQHPSPESFIETRIGFTKNVNKRFIETARQVIELRKTTSGETIITESDYALRGNSGMVLISRKVTRSSGKHTDVDTYEPSTPGRTASGQEQLVRRQSIDLTTDNGRTVQSTTIQLADPDGRLGAPRPADRQICQGDCK